MTYSLFRFLSSILHLPSSVFRYPLSVFRRPSSVFHPPSSVLKRTFDVAVSTLSLIALSPLFLLATVLIKLDSPGPVFYRGPRVGKDGKIFYIYKFRTMVVDAPKLGPGITREDDPRITRVGRWLRRLKIDEMPQLINVLKGEMSIIGPRPEDPRYVTHYTPEQRRVFSVRPGMASPAFIKYRHEEEILAAAGDKWEEVYRNKVLPDKLRMDLEYIDNWSFWGDLLIFAQAALSLFVRTGQVADASLVEEQIGTQERQGVIQRSPSP